MFRIIPLQYWAIILGGLLVISSFETFLADVPTSPTMMSVDEFLSTGPYDLPGWVTIPDAMLYWPEAIVVYSDKLYEPRESICVPLVNQKLLDDWDKVSQMPSPPPCFVIDFHRDDFQQQFPAVDAAIHAGSSLSPQDSNRELFKPCELSFRTDTSPTRLDGPKSEYFKKLGDKGFSDIEEVKAGSEPVQKGSAVIILLIAISSISLGTWRIVRKKK